MASAREYAAAIAVYAPLIAMTIFSQSEGREIRPSDHGLSYQSGSQSAGEKSPEMTSFFKGSSQTSSNVALPKAMNSSDTSWWSKGEGAKNGGGNGKDHTRDVLLIASLVCGITGVAVLAATALLYFVRFKSHRSPPQSSNDTNNK